MPELKYWNNPCPTDPCYRGDECDLVFCAICKTVFSMEGDIGYALFVVPQPTDPAESPYRDCPLCGKGMLYKLCIEHAWHPEGIPGNTIEGYELVDFICEDITFDL